MISKIAVSLPLLAFAFLTTFAVSGDTAWAASTQRRKTTVRTAQPAAPLRTAAREDAQLARARALATNGQYQEASKLLYQLSRDPRYARDSAQIKYILGLMLFEMKLNQSAAFIFYDLVRQESVQDPKSRFLRQGLEKLSVAADSLDSDVLLRYAIKQVKEDEFPPASRDMLFFRTGELKMQERAFADAAKQFARIPENSTFFVRARYKLALALAEAGDADRAQIAFEDLADRTKNNGVTDRMHVAALMGRARVMYQHQHFSEAIEAYRDIPRDTEAWHEALFESTWAMLRDGRFRSALSNFHSLHSPYFEDVYQPESLLLRAIVYLYICRYEEMSTTLDLFERIYRPVSRDIDNMLSLTGDPNSLFRELIRANDAARTGSSRKGLQIPVLVAKEILKEGDVRRSFGYLHNLEAEHRRIGQMAPGWRGSDVGMFAKSSVEKRIVATRQLIGKQIQRHLVIMQNELRDLFEQDGFLRFEMINGKKEALRKEIAGKAPVNTVDADTEREFYIQNGYEYWPFRGEYWLDEIGNYHYVGVQACE